MTLNKNMSVSLCGDCITLDANGWDEAMIGRPLPDPEPMSLLRGWLISPDESDHDCEGHFSWSPCEGCGCTLGGDRYCYVAIPAPDTVSGWGETGCCAPCNDGEHGSVEDGICVCCTAVVDRDAVVQAGLCPGCGYEIEGCVWGPDSLCRDCYEDRIPSPYCKHGTYIGYPGGPDYLCGPCEMGD